MGAGGCIFGLCSFSHSPVGQRSNKGSSLWRNKTRDKAESFFREGERRKWSERKCAERQIGKLPLQTNARRRSSTVEAASWRKRREGKAEKREEGREKHRKEEKSSIRVRARIIIISSSYKKDNDCAFEFWIGEMISKNFNIQIAKISHWRWQSTHTNILWVMCRWN